LTKIFIRVAFYVAARSLMLHKERPMAVTGLGRLEETPTALEPESVQGPADGPTGWRRVLVVAIVIAVVLAGLASYFHVWP
jgi:hypothetical protein